MPNRSKDWMAQGEHDLEHAKVSHEAENYDWACFAAHQAVEKAAKALHLAHGQNAWGHIVGRLLRSLPVAIPDDLVEKGRFLDVFYIPARYPDGHSEGPAFEHYGPLHSSQAIQHASDIIEFVRQALADA